MLCVGGSLKKTGWLRRFHDFHLACSCRVEWRSHIGLEEVCVLDDRCFTAVFPTSGAVTLAPFLVVLSDLCVIVSG
jgi:hypothetical protein